MVEVAFVTHFPIPPIYPYLPFTPGYLIDQKIFLSLFVLMYYIQSVTLKLSFDTLFLG